MYGKNGTGYSVHGFASTAETKHFQEKLQQADGKFDFFVSFSCHNFP